MSARPDRADRILAAAIAFLPKRRREWGAAMQAELAVIDEPGARLRYSSSCVRAVVGTPHAVGGLMSRAGVGAIAAVAVAFMTRAALGVAIQAAVLLFVLGRLSVVGVRDSRLGPVDGNAVARCWRMTAYLLVGVLLLWLLWPRNGGPAHDPSGFWVGGAMVAIFLAANLRLTASARPRTLVVVASVALGATATWEASMLGSSDVRAAPSWAASVIVASALLTVGIHRWRGWSDRITFVGCGAVFASCLLIFVAAGVTYRVAPSLAPDIAGSGTAGGLTAADRRDTNRSEAMDPYVGVLLAAGLAGLVIVGAGRAPNGRRIAAPPGTFVESGG